MLLWSSFPYHPILSLFLTELFAQELFTTILSTYNAISSTFLFLFLIFLIKDQLLIYQNLQIKYNDQVLRNAITHYIRTTVFMPLRLDGKLIFAVGVQYKLFHYSIIQTIYFITYFFQKNSNIFCQ